MGRSFFNAGAPRRRENFNILAERSGNTVAPDIGHVVVGTWIEPLYELRERGLAFITRQIIPVRYKKLVLDGAYRIDLLVEDAVIVELKSVEALLPVHSAQLLSYLRLTEKRVGLLINFNVDYLVKGVKRVVNKF